MTRTPQQNRELHQLVSKLNIDEETKEELVYNYTHGRETSSSKMERMECQALINNLRVKYNTSPESIKCDNMRKKIIALFRKQGYTVDGRVDIKKVYAWVLKYGYLKKPLNKYTSQELPLLVTQAEKMYNSFINSI